MTEQDNISIERERIKAIIVRKFEAIIKYREERIRSAKQRAISVYQKLLNDILFLIDNPNYVRKTSFIS